MSLFWTHAVLAVVLVLSWAVAGRTGYVVLLHKRAMTYRSLPLLVRTHRRTAMVWLALFALVSLTGLLLPRFTGTTATTHRWAGYAHLPAAIVLVWSGVRLPHAPSPTALLHVACAVVAMAALTVQAVTGFWLAAPLW